MRKTTENPQNGDRPLEWLDTEWAIAKENGCSLQAFIIGLNRETFDKFNINFSWSAYLQLEPEANVANFISNFHPYIDFYQKDQVEALYNFAKQEFPSFKVVNLLRFYKQIGMKQLNALWETNTNVLQKEGLTEHEANQIFKSSLNQLLIYFLEQSPKKYLLTVFAVYLFNQPDFTLNALVVEIMEKINFKNIDFLSGLWLIYRGEKRRALSTDFNAGSPDILAQFFETLGGPRVFNPMKTLEYFSLTWQLYQQVNPQANQENFTIALGAYCNLSLPEHRSLFLCLFPSSQTREMTGKNRYQFSQATTHLFRHPVIYKADPNYSLPKPGK